VTDQRQIVEVVGKQNQRPFLPVLSREKRQHGLHFPHAGIDRLIGRKQAGRRENMPKAQVVAQANRVFACRRGGQYRVDLARPDLP